MNIKDIEELKIKLEKTCIQGDQVEASFVANELEKALQSNIPLGDDERLSMMLYLAYGYSELDMLARLEKLLAQLSNDHNRFDKIVIIDFVQQLCELGKKRYEENKLSATKLVLKKAEEILKHQIEHLEDKDDIYLSQFINTVFKISMIYVNIGYIESPINWGQHIVRVLKESVPTNSRINLSAIELLSLIYESTNRYSEATTLLCATLSDIASGIFKEIDFTTELVKILIRILTAIGCDDNIESTLKKLIKIYRQHPLKSRNAMFVMLSALSSFYLKQGHPDLAEPLLNEIISEAREVKETEPNKFAEYLAIHGRALVMLKRFDEAENSIREAMEIRRDIKGEKSTDFALSLVSLGDIYNAAKRYAKAEEFVKYALKIFKEDKAFEYMIPDAIYTLSQALRPQNKFSEAESLLKEAFNIIESYENIPPTLEIVLHHELGFVYESSKKISEAAEEHLKALELFRKRFSTTAQGYLDILEAPIANLQVLGRHSDALPLLRELIAEHEKQNSTDKILYPWLLKLGISLYETGAINESEEYLQRTIKIAEKELGRKSFEYISAAYFLVEIYVSSDRLFEAEKQMQELLVYAKTLLQSDDLKLLSTMATQAIIFQRLGKEEEAIATYKDIINRTRSAKGHTIQIADLLRSMAEVSILEGQKKGALDLLLRVQELEIDLLETNDPLRQQTNNTIASLQKKIYPPKDIEWNPKAPVGKEVEYEELKLLSACLNAFWRRDYKLCIKLASIVFKDMRTGLLVILSHMYLKDAEKARMWCDALEKAFSAFSTSKLLINILTGKIDDPDSVIGSKDFEILCKAHYYLAERLLTQGFEKEASNHLKKAIEYASHFEENILEGAMAKATIQLLENPMKGPTPTEIENKIDLLNNQINKAHEDNRNDDALKLSIEARDEAKKLGLDHPIYAESLLILAEEYDKNDGASQADVLIEQGLSILSRCLQTNHPELSYAVQKVLFELIIGIDNNKREADRAIIVVSKTRNENGLLILIIALKKMIDSEFYRDTISKAFEAIQNNPAHSAILRFGIGQISADKAFTACKTDRQRSLVYFLEARRLSSIGDIVNARKKYESVLKINTKGLEQDFATEELQSISENTMEMGDKDTSFWKNKMKIAFDCLDSEQFEEAAKIANEVEIALENIDAYEVESVKLLMSIGVFYTRTQHLDQAINVFKKAYNICPKNNQYYSQLAENLGTIFLGKADIINAEKYLQEAYLDVKKESQNTSRYAILLQKMADLQLEKSNYFLAEQAIKELLDATKVVWGADNLHYADALERLTRLKLLQEHVELPIETYNSIYIINKKSLGETNDKTQKSLNNLAIACLSNDQQNLGVEYLEQSVQMVEKKCNPDDPVLVSTLLNVASTYYQFSFYLKSEELSRRSMTISAKQNDHKEYYIASAVQLADAIQAQGKFEETKKLRELVLTETAEIYGENSQEYLVGLCALALTFDAMREKDKAQAIYEKILTIL